MPEYTPFHPGAWHAGEGNRFAVGLQPVSGKKAGERTEVQSPFQVNAVLQQLP